MMTLDEAIIHCKEKACDNTQCALEHRQLAEWLEELKYLRAQKEQMIKDVVLETTIYQECDGDPLDGSEHSWLEYENNEIVNMPEWCKEGDKVKFIIVKDDD